MVFPRVRESGAGGGGADRGGVGGGGADGGGSGGGGSGGSSGGGSSGGGGGGGGAGSGGAGSGGAGSGGAGSGGAGSGVAGGGGAAAPLAVGVGAGARRGGGGRRGAGAGGGDDEPDAGGGAGDDRDPKRQRVIHEDDPERSAADDISIQDDGFPWFPNDHQARITRPGQAEKICSWGERQDLDAVQFIRMLIPVGEMLWRASVSERLFVREADEVNKSPMFFHSGPHISIAFNIGLQHAADSDRGHDGMQLLSYFCFLTSMVNCATNLPNCVLPTHYTDVVYTAPKKTLSIYWHGNGLYNKEFFQATDDVDGERVQEERTGVKPLNLCINLLPVTYKSFRNGVTKINQTIFAVTTLTVNLKPNP
jgi:hypothetical protein